MTHGSTAHVAYFALGGTIAMTPAPSGGVVARLTGEQLVASAGDLPVDVRVADPSAVPSASLRFTDLLDVADEARAAVDAGALGVVITQGTDTLEETAFLLDCVWDREAPLIVSGAMRNPTQPGDEGPANLRSAVVAAASEATRGRGVLIVFADEIHAARHVRKTHTTSTATFASPDLGAIGVLVEGSPRFLAGVPRLATVPDVSREALASSAVAMYTSVLDDDDTMLRTLLDGTHAGLVVAGFGVGHVPPGLVPVLGELAARIPVVLCSRTGAGSIARHTYGARGSERDLLGRGLIDGGFLHPYKARVLLRLLLAAGADRDVIDAAFARFR